MSSRTSRSLTLLTLLELNLYTSRDRWKRRDAQSDVMRDGDAVTAVPPVAVARVLVSYGYRLLLTYRAQTPSPFCACRTVTGTLVLVLR